MAGSLRAPEHPKREIMREDVAVWKGPDCEVCFQCFGTVKCQIGNFGKLHIVEEFQLDGSHVLHLVAPHYVFARLESMQVMTTLDDSTYANPFSDAVKVLAHLGFEFHDGVLTSADETQ